MLRNASLVGLLAVFLVSITRPSAQTWMPLNTGTTQDLYAVHFVSPDTGYVVGAAGTVLKTTNGGTSWQNVSPGISQALFDLHFFDADVGVVVGEEGTIMRTVNGGATWTPVTSGTTETLFSVAFGSTVGIAGAASQVILRSGDQGATWSPVREGFFGPPFRGVDMVDDVDGFVAGSNAIFQPLVGYTNDGGMTFEFVSFYLDSNEGYLEDIRFFDELDGFAVGVAWNGQGAICHSTDGGQNWSTTLYPGPLRGVDLFGSHIGCAVGDGGTIVKTTTGGQTWVPEASGTTVTLNDVDIHCCVGGPYPGVGYAVGEAGTVLRSTMAVALTEGPEVPRFSLEQNYPNPFTGQTAIRYHLPEAAAVMLRVVDALGREVATLAEGEHAAGPHEVTFDASRLSAGTYLYVLEAGASRAARPMLVRK